MNPYGYQSLHLAIHPGDLAPGERDRLTLSLGQGEAISLVGGDLIDWSSSEWQELDIPLERFGLEGAITGVQLYGTPVGTLYLDDVKLIPGPAPVEPTAVLETEVDGLPSAFALAQNYPNPFNSSTVIRFDLPAAQSVELAVHNLAGQRVATLVDGQRSAGAYTVNWDGTDDSGRDLASGVYLYELRAGERQETRKLLLLR